MAGSIIFVFFMHCRNSFFSWNYLIKFLAQSSSNIEIKCEIGRLRRHSYYNYCTFLFVFQWKWSSYCGKLFKEEERLQWTKIFFCQINFLRLEVILFNLYMWPAFTGKKLNFLWGKTIKINFDVDLCWLKKWKMSSIAVLPNRQVIKMFFRV